jgi:hypothetical protein
LNIERIKIPIVDGGTVFILSACPKYLYDCNKLPTPHRLQNLDVFELPIKPKGKPELIDAYWGFIWI